MTRQSIMIIVGIEFCWTQWDTPLFSCFVPLIPIELAEWSSVQTSFSLSMVISNQRTHVTVSFGRPHAVASWSMRTERMIGGFSSFVIVLVRNQIGPSRRRFTVYTREDYVLLKTLHIVLCVKKSLYLVPFVIVSILHLILYIKHAWSYSNIVIYLSRGSIIT